MQHRWEKKDADERGEGDVRARLIRSYVKLRGAKGARVKLHRGKMGNARAVNTIYRSRTFRYRDGGDEISADNRMNK